MKANNKVIKKNNTTSNQAFYYIFMSLQLGDGVQIINPPETHRQLQALVVECNVSGTSSRLWGGTNNNDDGRDLGWGDGDGLLANTASTVASSVPHILCVQ